MLIGFDGERRIEDASCAGEVEKHRIRRLPSFACMREGEVVTARDVAIHQTRPAIPYFLIEASCAEEPNAFALRSL